MKKYLLTILIILLITVKGLAQTTANNQNNDIEVARSIIAKYCNLLKLYAKKEDINIRKQLLDLVPKGYLVFNDFSSQYGEIEMYAYLNIISITYDNDIEIDFEEDISKISIVPYVTKNTTSSLFKGSITKKIKIKKNVKTIKNEIVVDINTKKIINIFQNNISNNITTIQESNSIDVFNNAIALYNNSQIESPERQRAVNILEKLANDGYYPAQLTLGDISGSKAIIYYKMALDNNYFEALAGYIKAYNRLKNETLKNQYYNDYQKYLNIGVSIGNLEAMRVKANTFIKQLQKEKSKVLIDSIRFLRTRIVEKTGNEWEIGIALIKIDYLDGIKDKAQFEILLQNILKSESYPPSIMETIGNAYKNNKEFEVAIYYYMLQESMYFIETDCSIGRFEKITKDIDKTYQVKFLNNIEREATGGNIQAMYILGYMYRCGYITGTKNDVLANKWFNQVSKKLDIKKIDKSVPFYLKAYGLPINTLIPFYKYFNKNDVEVEFFFAKQEKDEQKRGALMKELAETHNYAKAQSFLGLMYLYGFLGEANPKEAIFWFEKAAKQGDVGGQTYLANCYYYGLGTEVDGLKAVKLLEEAVRYKHEEALTLLGVIYSEGKNGIEKDEQKAIELLKQAALQGNSEAMYRLARLYKYSTSSTRNINEAVKWYTQAAEMGNMNGQTEIAEMYLRGEGVTKNIQESIKWYEKATEQSDSEKSAFWTELRLGRLYEDGEEVKQDIKTAMKWYKKGAMLNELNCIYRLAILLYNDGKYKEAFQWCKKLTDERNFAPAQYILGILYLEGKGTQKDKAEAVKWYKKAAAQGNEDAKKQLKELGY